MAISHKSLIIIVCFSISSLSYGEEITPLQYIKAKLSYAKDNLPWVADQLYIIKQLTPFQCIGAVAIGKALILNNVGKKLIQNGHANLSLEKAPSYLKTPQAMKKNLIFSLPVGMIAIASPLIIEKAEEAGKKHRESKENKNKETPSELL